MGDVNSELQLLRKIIPEVISSVEIVSTIPIVCQQLELPSVEWQEGASKYKMVSIMVNMAANQTVINAAKLMVSAYPGKRGSPNEEQCQRIQDCIWWIENEGRQEISNVVRFEIAEKLEASVFWGRSVGLQDFFSSANIYVKSYFGCFGSKNGFLYQDQSTMAELLNSILTPFGSPKMNEPKTAPQRVSVLSFLKAIEISEWPDQRFIRFIERVVHPEVQKLEDQKYLVQQLGQLLEKDGFEFWNSGFQGGSPVYMVRKKGGGVQGAPKYIIFAPLGVKPDIVLSDAVNMEIQIVKDADKFIVYDQPPPYGDLTWDIVVDWWCRKSGLNSKVEENRRKLGLRLRDSLQSEPECLLFETYFRVFRPKYGATLPALLPQVYLHFDPRAQREREKPVLFRQRMDFLMLLRNSVRIIIEIDGAQHYSDSDGQAVPRKYADMVAEDRRIKLLGYEVYRFGGAEFVDKDAANKVIINFFNDLFERHQVWSMGQQSTSS